jgi:hypothetical protein
MGWQASRLQFLLEIILQNINWEDREGDDRVALSVS